MNNNPKYIVVHHEAPPIPINSDRYDIVDQYHKSLGWGGIGYHYFIERSGQVKQGRKDEEEGAHTIGKNRESLGICMAGNMDIQIPTPEQINSIRNLIKQKMSQYNIPISNVVFHRFFATYSLTKQGVRGKNTTTWKTWDDTQPYKSCAGKNLDDQWISNLIDELVNIQVPRSKLDKLLAYLKMI